MRSSNPELEPAPQPRRRLRKGMFLLPSLFTMGNMGAGFYAILQAFQGTPTDYWHFDHAAIAIGFAVLFDGLDGRIARMTNTSSDFGRELDSLADCVTFGVAPAVLAWMWGFHLLPDIKGTVPWWLNTTNADLKQKLVQFGVIASFIFLTASASRLARFNIDKNPQPSNPGRPGKKYFVGMPTPGGAGVIAAIVHFTNGAPIAYWWVAAPWCALICAVAFLMISTWRYPSFKEIDFTRQHPFRKILLVAILFISIYTYSETVLFVLALTYMLAGVLSRFTFAIRRRSPSPPQPQPL